MPNYIYQVKDHSGSTLNGVVQAADLEEASRILRGDGRALLELRQQASTATAAARRPRRVRPDDVIYVTNQLAVMIATGVPITDALDGIAAQSNHSGLQRLLRDVCDQVKAGSWLWTALGRHPKVFDALYVNMIRASEASGTMAATLERLCQYLRVQRETRRQIRGAMAYPVGLLVFCVLVVTVMMTFVLPRFCTSTRAARPSCRPPRGC